MLVMLSSRTWTTIVRRTWFFGVSSFFSQAQMVTVCCENGGEVLRL
jgi:hypothetical protein